MGGSGSLEDIVAWFKKSGKEGHRVKIRDSLIRLSNSGCVKREGSNWVIVSEFKEKRQRPKRY